VYTVDVYLTNAQEDLAKSTLELREGQGELTLPGQSVVTLVVRSR
jgi:hypothetical protein